MKKAATLFISALLLLSTAAVCLADATHKVRKGDSLSRIARKYHVSVDRIREANDLSSDDLSVGTRLTIPGAKSRGKVKKARKTAPATGVESGGAPEAREPAEDARDAAAPRAAGVKDAQGRAPAATGAAASGRAVYHTVRKGETLASIARTYGVSVKEIKGLNRIRKTRRLKAGTRLLVRRGPRTYIVQDGDNIWKIARSHNRDAEELIELNGLETAELAPGQALTIDPQDTAPPSAAMPAEKAAEMEKEARAIAAAGTVPAGTASPEAAPEVKPPGIKDRIIGVARRMLDIPYRFGGNTMLGIDCSGYVQKVFSFLHIELPRSAREQFGIGEKIDKGDLKLGDLVFFRTYARYPSHVGIYVGNNEFIHASSKDKRVKIDSLDAPYYIKRFIGARRVVEARPENSDL